MVNLKYYLTPKRMEQYKCWCYLQAKIFMGLPSVLFYGASAFWGLVYFTDWKVIVDKIPIYNLKFKN